LARASFGLGVLALLLLVLSGGCIWGLAAHASGSGLQGPTDQEAVALAVGEAICHGGAALAALAAFVLGILGLVTTGRGAGKVEGRWRAVAGLAAASLAGLTLVLVYGVVAPVLASKARKLESANNLKRLGLAMTYYRDTYRGLPPAVLRDRVVRDPRLPDPRSGATEQPYSWRVAILPFLEEDRLYSQYRRDEPWDSPANKALLARMPRVFALPGSAGAAEGLTHYQALVGPETAFARPEGNLPILADLFPRGADQTMLVVEAAEAVPWTRPEDLPYAPGGPLPKVGGLVGKGFHALFADGSVRWIEAAQQESALRTLVPLKSR
jgi:hypothetical protein